MAWRRGWLVVCVVAACEASPRVASQRAALTTPPTGQWHFDEGSGTTTVDSSGSGNTGTLSSTGAAFGPGVSNDGMAFTGGYVALPRATFMQQPAWTWSGWVYPTILAGDIYSEGIPAVTHSIAIENNGDVRVASWNQNDTPGNWESIASPSGMLPLDAWTLLTITFENGGVRSGTVKFYANRSLVSQGTGQMEDNANPASAQFGNNVGVAAGQGGNPFSGYLDEVSIYTSALSAVEICGSGKLCGAQCIAQSACCTDGDCPGEPSSHRVGVCGAGGVCALTCAADYQACAGVCVPKSGCCKNTDCNTPPNGCYAAAGTCASNVCSYALDDGAPCDADQDACTPNDTCKGGVCVADTAHAVTCIQRECHSKPSCNTTTGDCDDAIVGGACGGNGCTPTGTCSAGACSSASQTKDCSAESDLCKVGLCDPSNGNCASSNKPNGTSCAPVDRCIVTPACSGGVCTGAKKECVPSGPCRVSTCDSSTGQCDEVIAAVGTSCIAASGCAQNATCDATGACVGDSVPDGNPCAIAGCGAAVCRGGACACLSGTASLDGAVASSPSDLGFPSVPTASHRGCAMSTTTTGGDACVPCVLALAMLVLRRRRAAQKATW